MLYLGGGVLALAVFYHFYKSYTAGNSASNTGAGSTGSAADYAALGTTEASDVAALQQQEQSDIANLTGQLGTQTAAYQQGLAGLTAQEQADVANLEGGIQTNQATFASMLAPITGAIQGLEAQMNAASAGVAAPPSATGPTTAAGAPKVTGVSVQQQTSYVTTHAGGPFYDWYKSIFNRPPPSQVSSTNPVYVAWTKGVAKATVKKQNPGGIK